MTKARPPMPGKCDRAGQCAVRGGLVPMTKVHSACA